MMQLSCTSSPASTTLGQHWELPWGLGSAGGVSSPPCLWGLSPPPPMLPALCAPLACSSPLRSHHQCQTCPTLTPSSWSRGTLCSTSTTLPQWSLPQWSRCHRPPWVHRPPSRPHFWHVPTGIWLLRPGSGTTSLDPGCSLKGFSGCKAEAGRRRGVLDGISPYRGKSGFHGLWSLPPRA